MAQKRSNRVPVPENAPAIEAAEFELLRQGIVDALMPPPEEEAVALAPEAAGAAGAGNFSQFIYRGGPVVNTPRAHMVFAGDWSSTANQTRATTLVNFMNDLMHSRYMNMLAQYGCGSSGSVVQEAFVANSDTEVTFTEMVSILQTAITNNNIEEPTHPNDIYLLFLDDATHINTPGGFVSCENVPAGSFGVFGFHNSFTTTAGNTCLFAVIPGLDDACLQAVCTSDTFCSLHLSQTQEQRQTQVISHEFAEMISNPLVGHSNESWSNSNGDENGDICNGSAGLITVGTNVWNVQQMYSKWDDMQSNGASTCVLGADNPLPSLLPAVFVAVDKSNYGKDEVDASLILPSDPGVFKEAFYVAVDGFTANDLGITSASLSGVPNVAPVITTSPTIPGMHLDAAQLVADDPSLGGEIQRFTWVYNVRFDNSNGFPPAVGQITQVLINARVSRVTSPAVPTSGSSVFQLIHEPNPYELDGIVSWLSTDLRVFQVRAGDSKFGATMGSDAPGFIQAVISNLNNHMTGGDTFESSISVDENLSQLELSETVGSVPVFNFALAKVRFRSLVADAPNVRVFFRLFPVATTSTAYDPSGSYKRGGSGGTVIPVLGVQGGAITTIPCFASARVDTSTQSMNDQTDLPNILSTAHDASGNETFTYFGCWLDINQPTQPRFPVNPSSAEGPFTGGGLKTIQELVRNTHQCLVAEIAFDPTPINPGDTPAGSDKLAQRNLAIVESDNPGGPDSHRIPNTFEVRRPPLFTRIPGRPEELLIDSRGLPAGSAAQIFLPGVGADALLRLADEAYASHHFTKVDDATLKFPAGGLTYLPVPPGIGPNLPGLLTIDLPTTVRKGQAFKVVVRQLTNTFSEFFPPPPPIGLRAQVNLPNGGEAHNGDEAPDGGGGGGGGGGGRRGQLVRWQQITGSYQVSIPVSTSELMLPNEERKLAVLKWIQLSVPAGDRWFPVFNRYVDQIADRVRALGGKPEEIQPSPGDKVRPKPVVETEITGKVCEVSFDCHGDFEGFKLECCGGSEKRGFHSHEPGIRKLVMNALKDHLTVTVHLEEEKEKRNGNGRGHSRRIERISVEW